MGARTGSQYLEGLRKTKREIWVDGKRIEDVTAAGASGLDVRSGCLSRCFSSDDNAPRRCGGAMRVVESCAGCAEKADQRVDRIALRRIMCLSQRGCGRGPCQPA